MGLRGRKGKGRELEREKGGRKSKERGKEKRGTEGERGRGREKGKKRAETCRIFKEQQEISVSRARREV